MMDKILLFFFFYVLYGIWLENLGKLFTFWQLITAKIFSPVTEFRNYRKFQVVTIPTLLNLSSCANFFQDFEHAADISYNHLLFHKIKQFSKELFVSKI